MIGDGTKCMPRVGQASRSAYSNICNDPWGIHLAHHQEWVSQESTVRVEWGMPIAGVVQGTTAKSSISEYFSVSKGLMPEVKLLLGFI